MKKIKIFTTDYCPYCVRAKAYFKDQNVPYEEINLSQDPEELMALKERTGLRTVPQIFVDDVLVGGYTDMMEKIGQGVLSLKS